MRTQTRSRQVPGEQSRAAQTRGREQGETVVFGDERQKSVPGSLRSTAEDANSLLPRAETAQNHTLSQKGTHISMHFGPWDSEMTPESK